MAFLFGGCIAVSYIMPNQLQMKVNELDRNVVIKYAYKEPQTVQYQGTNLYQNYCECIGRVWTSKSIMSELEDFEK